MLMMKVLGPFFVMAALFWGVLIGSAPGGVSHHDPWSGVRYAVLITLRFALVYGLIRCLLVSESIEQLLQQLTWWRVPNNVLATVICTVALVPEVTLRSEQISMARYARGAVRRRTRLAAIGQVPVLLRPLLALLLRSAIERSELWEERRLLSRFREVAARPATYLTGLDVLVITISALWLLVSLLTRVR